MTNITQVTIRLSDELWRSINEAAAGIETTCAKGNARREEDGAWRYGAEPRPLSAAEFIRLALYRATEDAACGHWRRPSGETHDLKGAPVPPPSSLKVVL